MQNSLGAKTLLTSWALAAALPLWACSSSGGGSSMSASGSGGASSGGSSGASGGTGGSAASVGGAGDIRAACVQCGSQKCSASIGTCNTDTGCSGLIERYYSCLSDPQRSSSVLDCGFLFTEEGGGAKANEVEDCMTGAQTGGDGIGCAEACGRAGGSGGAGSSCVRAPTSDADCTDLDGTTPSAWSCPDTKTAAQFEGTKAKCFSVNFIPAGLCCSN